MRIDMNNIQSEYQQLKQRKRRQWIIFCLGIFAIAYCGILVTVLVASRDANVVSGQAAVSSFEGAVVTRDAGVAAPVVANPAKMTGSPRFRGNMSLIHTYAPQGSIVAAPQHTWQSTGAAITVHTTSTAQVHNVGSGVSTGAVASGGVSVTAFTHSTSSMVVPTLAWASAHSLSVSNTRAAQASIIDAGTPERLGKPGTIKRVDGEDDDDSPEEPFKDPVPIGNGLWALLLLAAGYGVFMLRRRKVGKI